MRGRTAIIGEALFAVYSVGRVANPSQEKALAGHGLIRVLRDLKDNVRGAVSTQALWGIPYNLYAPYVSVYRLALGMNDAQIGLLATVSAALRVLWTMMAGAIADKLRRRRTNLIFDLVSWSVACVIWAVAQDFTYFLVGAVFNASWRVTDTAWQCLLVEDTGTESGEPDGLPAIGLPVPTAR